MNSRINKPRVFLSHASKDKPFIERIARDLRRCHIEYWLDKEQIRVGRSWLKGIFQDGLPTCDAVFVYLTEDALRSKMVEKELDVASVQQLEQRGVALLPYVSNPDVRRQLRSDLQALQCKEWNAENYDEMLPEVVAEIWHSYLERTVNEKPPEDLDELKLEGNKLREVLDELKLENSKLLEEVESLKAKNNRPRRTSNSTSKLVHFRYATIDDLANRELFRNVDPTELSRLLPSTRLCRLPVNQPLWPTRNDVDYIYVVLSGYVAIWTQAQFDQQKQAFLGWRGPEQLIGEITSKRRRNSSIFIDARDTCEFIEMRSDLLELVADSKPEVHKNIANLSMINTESERHRSELAQIPHSGHRVAQALIFLAEERCGGDPVKQARFTIPGTLRQSDLAAYAACRRETLNRQLVELRIRGVISYTRRSGGMDLTILNWGELRKVSKAGVDGKRRFRTES